MADLNPNGSTGTFEPACWMNPEDAFNHTDLNTLAENTAFFVQEYTEVISAYHKVQTLKDTVYRPQLIDGDFVQSYIFLAGGTHLFCINTLRGLHSGSLYAGTVRIDGTVSCTFGTAGTTAYVNFINTGPRWVLTSVQIVPENISQTIDNRYSIAYRRIL